MDKFDNIVLSYNLQLNQFRDELSFSKKLRDIEWQYQNVTEREYNHADFGFYTNDVSLARNHFFMQIRILASEYENVQNDEERMRILNVACEDLQKYVFACKMLWRGEDVALPDAERMISLVLAYGGACPLYSVVKKMYDDTIKDYDKNADQVYEEFFLDFYEIYEKYGDYALYIEQNVNEALLYYELASLDWYNFENQEKWRGNEVKKNEILQRKKKFQWMQRILWQPFETCVIWEKQQFWTGDDTYKNLLIVFMHNLKTEKKDEIVRSATNYFLYIAQLLEEEHSKAVLRMPVLLAHKVRDYSLAWMLVEYAATSEKVFDETIQRDIFNCIRSNQSGGFSSIKKYLAQEKENTHTLDICLQLLLVAEHVHILANYLRVSASSGNELGYYTSLDTFSYMLPFKAEDEMVGRLSVMNIAYMNDPNEGRTLQKCLFSGNVPFEGDTLQRKDARYPYVFLKCFTPQIDFLPMWEMYGDHASGCCLVLDWNLTQNKSKEVPLYHVCYLTDDGTSYNINSQNNPDLECYREIEVELKELVSCCNTLYKEGDEACMDALHSFLNQILYLFKEDSYAYEREVRICYKFSEVDKKFRHTSNEFGKLYVATDFPIAIKEVILGSKFAKRSEVMPFLQEQIDLMCQKCNMPSPKITLSDIEYR